MTTVLEDSPVALVTFKGQKGISMTDANPMRPIIAPVGGLRTMFFSRNVLNKNIFSINDAILRGVKIGGHPGMKLLDEVADAIRQSVADMTRKIFYFHFQEGGPTARICLLIRRLCPNL